MNPRTFAVVGPVPKRGRPTKGWNGQGELVCPLRGQSLESRLAAQPSVVRARMHCSEAKGRDVTALGGERPTTVEQHQRYLAVEGVVLWPDAPYPGLRTQPTTNGRLCILSFASEEVPLPAQFDVAFSLLAPEVHCPTRINVVAATQQYLKPYESIPSGWRTLCILEFPEGVPDLIQELPVLPSWDYAQERVGLCRINDYGPIVQQLRKRRTTKE